MKKLDMIKSACLILALIAAPLVSAQRPNRQLFPLKAYTLTEYVPIEYSEAFAMPEEFAGESYAGVAVNNRGNLVVFSRGNVPFLEFDSDGQFVRSFGREGLFRRAHGLHITADDSIWATDVADHVVMKLDRNGNELMTLGTRGRMASGMNLPALICSISPTTWRSTPPVTSTWPRARARSTAGSEVQC